MSEQSIRDEIADEIAGVVTGQGYYSMTIGIDAAREAADLILASPVIRRIQAEAASKALCEFADAVRMPATLFNSGDGPITANDLLRQRAAAIEKGESTDV